MDVPNTVNHASNRNQDSVLVTIALVLLLGVVILTTVSQTTPTIQAGDPPDNFIYLPVLANGSAPNCRFGVNVIQSFDKLKFNELPVGWYIDYLAKTNPEKPNGATYASVIRLSQTGPDLDDYSFSPNEAAILTAITNNPGAKWFIGNEPDRRDLQDDTEPHVYAAVYHELYTLIKMADPTAQIYAGTIVQPSPIRLQYLDMILEAYEDQNGGQKMPVDGWSIHNFLLNEVSCAHNPNNCWGAEIPPGINLPQGEVLTLEDNIDSDLFISRIEDFRQWMHDRGYKSVPLSVSEYGILIPESYQGFEVTKVNEFMTTTFDYMLNATDPVLGNPHDNNRLVQTFSWYSTGNPNDVFNGYLFSGTTFPWGLSVMGQNYTNYVKAIPAQVDLYPTKLVGDIVSGGATSTVTLTATIANSGNENIATSGSVNFYNGNPKAGRQFIGTGTSLSIAGCGANQQASFVWNNVPSNTYQIYVQVNANRPDVNTGNNAKGFSVTVP